MEECESHGSAKPRGTCRPVHEQPFQSMLSTTYTTTLAGYKYALLSYYCVRFFYAQRDAFELFLVQNSSTDQGNNFNDFKVKTTCTTVKAI